MNYSNHKILLVIDDEPILEFLSFSLQKKGFEVLQTNDALKALELVINNDIDIVVTNSILPKMSLIELCKKIRATKKLKYVYCIALILKEDIKIKIDVNAEIDEYIQKPLKINDSYIDKLEHRINIGIRIARLEQKVQKTHNEISDMTVKLKKETIEANKNIQNAKLVTILCLAKLSEYRDKETGLHLERIREYSKLIADEISKLDKFKDYITLDYIEDIYNSSILHDIGKVGINDAILLKPGRLTDIEFERIKEHSVLGGDTIKSIEARLTGQSFLALGKEIAYYHHEKWDGTGYPKGLKGNKIPLSARIVALPDVYDALRSKRIYKSPLNHEQTKEIILKERAKHFDPDIVDAFLRREEDFKKIAENMKNW